jgi:hypothetical protein
MIVEVLGLAWLCWSTNHGIDCVHPKFEVKHVVLDDITSGDLTMVSVGRILDPEMLVRWSAFHLLDSS